MFSPTILLFVVLGLVGMFGTGASVGYKWSERAHGAALAAAQVKAIDDANTAVELAVERTLATAKKEANARLSARTARMKGEIDAAQKSRPECDRDDVSLRLLHDAISAANGETPAADKLPDEVRPAAASGGWLGTVREALGVRGGRDIRPVPEASRGLRGVGE